MNSSNNGKRPRRKQHGRAQSNQRQRQKHIKKAPPTDTSIEEQLRRQRKKQRYLESNNKKTQQKPQALGNYRYDAQRKAYFPADSFPARGDKKRAAKSNNKTRQRFTTCAHTKCLINSGAISCQTLQYTTEISCFSTRQHQLRSLWAARLMRANTTIVPTTVVSDAIQSQRTWSMLPPLQTTNSSSRNDSTVTLDLVCKTRLHSSARTFDVHYSGGELDKLPSIATLVQGGSQVTFAHFPQVHNVQEEESTQEWQNDVCLQISPVANSGESEPHAIRFAPSNIQNSSDFLIASISKQEQEQGSSVVRLWRRNDTELVTTGAVLPLFGNDLAFSFSEKEIGIATNSLERNCFCLVNMEYSNMVRQPSFAPRSDALCIESFSSGFVTGHRNGMLSLVDTRRQDTQFFSAPASAGSLTKILILKDNHQLLTKHSWGECLLWDLRKMNASPVLHLQVPKLFLQKTKSSCCNGVAVDPTGSVVIAPFANAHEQTSLGFWSLASGAFSGYNVLDQTSNDETAGLKHCELSSTITSAWNPIDASSAEDDDDMVVTRNKNAWGLWFKYGLTAAAATPNGIGSIHQVTFPGRLLNE